MFRKRWQNQPQPLSQAVSEKRGRFTCNEVSDVQPAILSRLRVVEVKAPNAAQMPAVVRSIDRSVRESNPPIARLFHPLSPDVIACLKTVNPRQLSSLLPHVYGVAAIGLKVSKTKRRVHPRHVELVLNQRRVKSDIRFGFVPDVVMRGYQASTETHRTCIGRRSPVARPEHLFNRIKTSVPNLDPYGHEFV